MSTRDKVFMNVPLRSSIYQSTFSVSADILSPCILQLDFSVTVSYCLVHTLGLRSVTCEISDLMSTHL